MKHITLLVSFIISFSLFAATAQDYSHIKREYLKFEKILSTTREDGVIGGIMKYKKMKGFEFLWDIRDGEEDYSVIRILREHNDGTPDFYVSYYVGRHLVEGRKVVRRFIEPMSIGAWRNDTVDFNTNEYLGLQGLENPQIDTDDFLLLHNLGIK